MLGFIGCGLMGGVILEGILEKKILAPDDLLVYDADTARTVYLREKFGIRAASGINEVCSEADKVILAVKPQNVEELFKSIKDRLSDQLIISIAAGIQIDLMQKLSGKPLRVIRIMPNTPCLVGEGMSVICPGEGVLKDEIAFVADIMQALGKAVVLDEKLLDAATGLNGCGPAYFLLVLEALTDGGVEVGLSRDTAQMLAVQTMLGTAKMVLETGEHPASLKNKVTSPGGLTSAALLELEEGGVRASLIKAVIQAVQRGKDISM